ncbi:glycosyltransferase [Virgibacillus halodenitrificans]|uniref:glycosyltransferase n=1 Tax=Virgibacillus halodenitrificans TaxID=1482 RepID=UPI0013682C31|nr:glycosyltransferase [Virgibacillus halodenitrificans]MYL47159.1 glycosyltransferase [Virgibacillus halodenitrificans]
MKNKVLFIIPSLAGGGAERVFVNIVNTIDKSIFDVTLVCLSTERNVYEVSSDVRVINLKSKRVRNATLKILRLIRKERPSLVVSTLGHLNSMLLMLKLFFPKNTKLIIRQTNIMSFNRGKNTLIRKKAGNKLYKNADMIVCQSKFMKDDFINITGVKSSNVIKIYNPVDLDSMLIKSNEDIKYEFNEGQINIFFAGRLEEVKRIPLIIDAFQNFREKNHYSKLYILGEGPKKSELMNYTVKKKLSHSVEFLGFQQNPYKWLKHADLFIMASKHEGMPNVLIEAIALGIPVLVLKHPGGTIDILRTLNIEDRFVNNLVIDKNSFDAYDKRVLSILKANFGVEIVVKQYEDLFKSVIQIGE